VDQLVANLTTAYLQHLTMYSIYIESYLLLIGYCFVAPPSASLLPFYAEH